MYHLSKNRNIDKELTLKDGEVFSVVCAAMRQNAYMMNRAKMYTLCRLMHGDTTETAMQKFLWKCCHVGSCVGRSTHRVKIC